MAIIRDARVLHYDGWVVGRDDTFLGEFSLYGLQHASGIYRLLRNRGTRRHLQGTTLNLLSEYAYCNFFHWMMDTIPRVEIFLGAGFTWDDVDHILLPDFSTFTIREVLAALRLPVEKVIYPARTDRYSCERLFQPSLPGGVFTSHPAAVAFHRSLLPAVAPVGNGRLYIPRRGARCLTNEAEVDARLAALGFEEANTDDFNRFRAQLAGARVIVAVHGAAMTNLLYARPGTRVLELLPSNHVDLFFRSLTASAGMEYGVIVGRSLRRPFLWRGVPVSPFTISMSVFEAGLKALLVHEYEYANRPAVDQKVL